jgi:uncharacterized protein with GYD domain
MNRRWHMPKYLVHGSYTEEGWQGLLREGGSSRREAAARSLASVGGTLEAFYFAYGADNFYIIADIPDDVSAAAIAMAGNVSGTLNVRMVALLTLEEVDRAASMAVDFRPPGH